MKVLLTGGAGYIGSHTAVELMQAGHNVIIADNFSNSSPEILYSVKKITNISPKLYTVDVKDYNALEQVFREESIDAVIHLAGYKAVGESVADPLKYYYNNLGASITVIRLMKKYNVKILVFSSSATVYGTPDTVPVTENMPAKECANPYGRTKLMAEQIYTDIAEADSSMSVIILRYFNPVGAHKSGLLKEQPLGAPQNLMPNIVAAAEGNKKLKVYGNDWPTKDGTGIRDYIHVVDLARGHIAALNYTANFRGVEIFNLGTGKPSSVLDVIHTFEKVHDIKLNYEIVSRREGDIAEYWADPSKAEDKLDWKAELSLDDMCRDAWRHQD